MSRDAKDVDRRTFLGTTAAATAAMFIKPALVHGTKANSAIRVGLLGCGGGGGGEAADMVGEGGGGGGGPGGAFSEHPAGPRAPLRAAQQTKGGRGAGLRRVLFVAAA